MDGTGNRSSQFQRSETFRRKSSGRRTSSIGLSIHNSPLTISDKAHSRVTVAAARRSGKEFRRVQGMVMPMSAGTGYFDLQVNGYGGVDFNKEGLTADDLHRACERLEADGV